MEMNQNESCFARVSRQDYCAANCTKEAGVATFGVITKISFRSWTIAQASDADKGVSIKIVLSPGKNDDRAKAEYVSNSNLTGIRDVRIKEKNYMEYNRLEYKKGTSI
jgi:hypothetical protein